LLLYWINFRFRPGPSAAYAVFPEGLALSCDEEYLLKNLRNFQKFDHRIILIEQIYISDSGDDKEKYS
jgi:hypothetical protein